MEAKFRTPKHLVVKGGQIIEQRGVVSQFNAPKVIHYNHTIRMLPETCDHQQQMERLKQMFQGELREKNIELNKLHRKIEDKENDIQFRRCSFDKQLTLPSTSKFQISRIEDKEESQMTMNESKLVHSQRKISDFQTLFPDVEPEEEDKQVQKVKQEMKSTMQVLSNVTDVLNRPKRKYEFFYKNIEANLKEIHQNFEVEEEKKLDETKLNINDNECNYSQHKIIVNCQCLESEQSLLDQTTSQQSCDTATFLQKIIKEHEELKQTLINLQQSTKKEIDGLKNYYQGQIQNYIDILSQQKGDTKGCNLNSTRSNIECPIQSKSVQIQQPQELAWYKSSQFEIIFPQENILTPDLLQD